jgi:hypothetical protein
MPGRLANARLAPADAQVELPLLATRYGLLIAGIFGKISFGAALELTSTDLID